MSCRPDRRRSSSSRTTPAISGSWACRASKSGPQKVSVMACAPDVALRAGRGSLVSLGSAITLGRGAGGPRIDAAGIEVAGIDVTGDGPQPLQRDRPGAQDPRHAAGDVED